MRTFLIPGHGEEPWIFDNLHPLLSGEKIFIDNWQLLNDLPSDELSATIYAQYLIDLHDINSNDLVIGHSMGGWIALQIKQITGCRIIQVSSFTNLKKVVAYPFPHGLMYWLARRGWGFNDFSLKLLVWLYYRNKSSCEVFIAIFKRLQHGDKEIVAKQLMVIFKRLRQPITVAPDLRIHAKADHIVRYPDESFVEVPGDHFSLYTYAEKVARPITDLFSS